LDYYNIPTNFTDTGRLLGIFEIRNTVEAVLLALPLLYFGYILAPFGFTGKLIAGLTLAIPTGGFALVGINDDCLSRYLRTLWQWLWRRENLL